MKQQYLGVLEYENPSRYYHIVKDRYGFIAGSATNVGFMPSTKHFKSLELLNEHLESK